MGEFITELSKEKVEKKQAQLRVPFQTAGSREGAEGGQTAQCYIYFPCTVRGRGSVHVWFDGHCYLRSLTPEAKVLQHLQWRSHGDITQRTKAFYATFETILTIYIIL